MKRLLGPALALGIAFPALAQTAPAPGAPGFLAQLPPGAVRLSDVLGTEVIGSDIRRLGTIEDVVLDHGGTAVAAIVESGGFLGLGEKKVAVPYAALLWNFDVGPTTGPSSSTTGGVALPGRQELQTRSAPATEPGPANPHVTGTVGDPSRPAEGLRPQGATVPITGSGEPRRAVLQMSQDELRRAPEFKARGD